ncbi:VOC family protein [Novosphingobium sp. ES2-1]|uniref:VOC family protein n=1 Tax=Novosphingobium sp. ES2-1 TaxID=2780074 RepID=UPI00187F5C73|nr:VOC family protein [Novosphingobium sp. ES2-1]QOV96415.1 VOC family protein [Novosphingobium sp. ES2-1]
MPAELANPHFDAGIVTNDRAGALAFWNGLLGFTVEGEVSFPGLTIVRLKVGAAILRLCIPDAEVTQKAATGDFDVETGLRYLTIGVRNLDAVVAEAGAAGYPVPYPPRETRPGHRTAQIQDGQGVTVELFETVQA